MAKRNASETEVVREGPVLDLARGLLEKRRDDKVLSLISQLVARNAELEKKLAGRGFKNSETISSKQLLPLIDTLPLRRRAGAGADGRQGGSWREARHEAGGPADCGQVP